MFLGGEGGWEEVGEEEEEEEVGRFHFWFLFFVFCFLFFVFCFLFFVFCFCFCFFLLLNPNQTLGVCLTIDFNF